MSIATKLQAIIDIKTAIRNAISAKSVAIDSTTPFSQYASKIESIQTGGGVVDPNAPVMTIKVENDVITKGLKMVTPSAKKIGLRAFQSLYLDELVVSEGVEEVGESSFSGGGASILTLPSTLKLIGVRAFSGLSSLNNVTFGHSGDGELKVSFAAFDSCLALISVDIGSRVNSLPNSCFATCRMLSSITLAPSIQALGDSCFSSAKITSFDNENIRSLGSGVFASCSELTHVNLPNLQTMGATVFSGCSKLISFNIGSAITELGNSVFSTTASLKQIVLPESLLKIGSYLGNGSVELQYVEIPSRVTSFSASPTFNNCAKLKTIKMKPVNPPTRTGATAFFPTMPADCKIFVPDESLNAYKTHASWSSIAANIFPMSEFVMPTIT